MGYVRGTMGFSPELSLMPGVMVIGFGMMAVTDK
jgi:hypothetical protein